MMDIEKLFGYAVDVMNNETEMRLHRKTLPAFVWIPSLDGSTAYRAGELDARSTEGWYSLGAMCSVLGVEVSEVIAVVKSIGRWEKHGGKYDRIFSYESREADRIARYLERDSYTASRYRSTYRKIK